MNPIKSAIEWTPSDTEECPPNEGFFASVSGQVAIMLGETLLPIPVKAFEVYPFVPAKVSRTHTHIAGKVFLIPPTTEQANTAGKE